MFSPTNLHILYYNVKKLCTFFLFFLKKTPIFSKLCKGGNKTSRCNGKVGVPT